MVVDCWEEMVDCVEVEACVFEIRKEASFVVCYGVSACVNLVFGEVSDFLVSLRPNFAVSVTDESHFEEVSRNGNVHHSVQSQSREEIICHEVNKGDLDERAEVKKFRLPFLDYRHNDGLQQDVGKSAERQEHLFDYPEEPFVFGTDFEEVSDWLKCLDFIIEKSVGIDVMTHAMHDLPLFMGEACDQPKVTKWMVSHVDKVVSDSEYREHRKTAKDRQEIGLKACSKYEENEPDRKENIAILH